MKVLYPKRVQAVGLVVIYAKAAVFPMGKQTKTIPLKCVLKTSKESMLCNIN